MTRFVLVELRDVVPAEYHRPPMRPVLLFTLVVFLSCAAPPPPTEPPAAAPPPPPVDMPAEERVVGTVRVTASALNVRAAASADAEVLTQVKRGETLSVLGEDESWVKVRLANGKTGWVAARFVSSGAATPAKSAPRKRSGGGGCPPDSDFAFVETPTLAFSDSGAHGIVVVEARVNTKGVVTSTKVMSNTTGDEALALLAEREIRSAKFSPPIRACVARSFVFTYRRTF